MHRIIKEEVLVNLLHRLIMINHLNPNNRIFLNQTFKIMILSFIHNNKNHKKILTITQLIKTCWKNPLLLTLKNKNRVNNFSMTFYNDHKICISFFV